MTKTLHPDLAEHLATYPYAIVSYVDTRGYPVNVATGFRAEAFSGLVYLDAFDAPDQPGQGAEIELTFSHVRPRPGSGYDQRRYVNLWGYVIPSGTGLVVAPDRVSGWDEQRVPFVEYCERNLSQANRYMARLSEQRGSPVAPHLPLRWRLFLATRLPFLTATLVPIFLGAAIARAHGYSAWWLSVLALAGASCIHLGLNVLNDIFDVSSGADIENVTPTPFSGGSRVVLYGLVSRRSMWALALIFFIVGGGIGLYLGFTRATVIIWLGVAGVALSIAYTAPPFKLVYRGLGDVAVAAGFGPIMTIGSYVVVARHLSFEALYASLPVSLFVMLILYVNQVPDRLGDGRAGKRTVVVRFRRSSIIRAYDVLAATGFALIVAGVAAGITPFWTLLALGPIPLAVRVHRGLTAHYDEPFALIPALASNIGLHLFTGIGLIFGYALDTAI